MSAIVKSTRESIKTLIDSAAKKAIADGVLPSAELNSFNIEVPADRTHGDFAVNAAMVWTKAFPHAAESDCRYNLKQPVA